MGLANSRRGFLSRIAGFGGSKGNSICWIATMHQTLCGGYKDEWDQRACDPVGNTGPKETRVIKHNVVSMGVMGVEESSPVGGGEFSTLYSKKTNSER